MNLLRLPWRRATSVVLTVLATAAAGAGLAAPAQAANPVTPGSFTGYGFDQCVAPTQAAMDRWLTSSPFWAVGIYISGDSRGCPVQPNLNPTWISTQLRNGWRLLPITLGPQASCTTREKYQQQVRINPDPTTLYAKARAQGRAEATKAVRAAQALGISPRSTLWYDLEAFPLSGTTAGIRCRESALSFLSAWTKQLHDLGYVSGVYSSAGSGMKALDDARVLRPGRFFMPDQIWIADWNGKADIHSSYIRRDGWMPHARVHQYRGGHNETHGGVTINIDSNYMSLGRGSQPLRKHRHCGGINLDLPDFHQLAPGTTRTGEVKALQCILRQKKRYGGLVSGHYNAATQRAVRSYKATLGLRTDSTTTLRTWTGLLSAGPAPIVKHGSAQPAVRRLQRALNAAVDARLPVNGLYSWTTTAAVRAYQTRVGLPRTGVVASDTWSRLQRGRR